MILGPPGAIIGGVAIVTLLTDFGWSDYYVAAVKGTLLRLAPDVLPVDVAHDVPAGDLDTASFLLAAAAPHFPAGTIHLAVVDPGVGSDRRILAAAADGFLFVAPDNGLLTPLLDGAETYSVERSDLFLPGPGATFHGRDRFAPVAAALARGEALTDLGPAVADAVRRPAPQPRRTGHELHGTVRHIDRYGNLVTDIPASWLPDGPFEVTIGSTAVGRHVTHYDELSPAEAGSLVGSLGTLELSLNGASLAAQLGAERGATVRVRPR